MIQEHDPDSVYELFVYVPDSVEELCVQPGSKMQGPSLVAM